jgi:ABC-type multidrug transport system permease subunit
MLGMLSIMTSGSPTASQIGTASLLVPQGWAVRGLVQTMNGAPFAEIAPTVLMLAAWGIVFFAVGVWRFNRRYA